MRRLYIERLTVAHLPWVRDVGDMFVVTLGHPVAETRCTRTTLVFRRAAEVVELPRCEACGGELLVSSEVRVSAEISAKAGVMRYRRLGANEQPLGPWEYAPLGERASKSI